MILRELTSADEAAFLAGLKQWQGEDPQWYSFHWQPGMTFEEMLSILQKERVGVDLPPGRVRHTMLYAFVDNEIIGRLSVRHELNDYLIRIGGNIGYAVAPKYRNRGFGSEIVRRGLEFCSTAGLHRILVTCDDDNPASWKIIERFGGVLENKILDDAGNKMVRRYWIAVPAPRRSDGSRP
jgi:predicted acetyltransferase